MLTDCYNFKHNQTAFYMAKKGNPTEVDASTDGVTYVRYGTGANCAIHKITESDGVTTIRWTYGAWADRATLEYTHGLDEAINA